MGLGIEWPSLRWAVAIIALWGCLESQEPEPPPDPLRDACETAAREVAQCSEEYQGWYRFEPWCCDPPGMNQQFYECVTLPYSDCSSSGGGGEENPSDWDYCDFWGHDDPKDIPSDFVCSTPLPE